MIPNTEKFKTTDLNGRETVKWFDSCLYPVMQQDADGRRTTTIYNLDINGDNKYGEAQSVIDRNGNTTEYERDANGNIIKIYNPDSSFKEFYYDNKNSRVWEKDGNGKYIFYIYETSGMRLVKKAQPLNGTDQ